MSAGVYNFTIEQGTTFRTTIQLLSSTNTPRNITGYTARGHIRETADSAIKIAQFTCSISEPELGRITLSLSPEETSTISINAKGYANLKKFVYDLEIYKALEGDKEEVFRILNGYIYLSPEVTK